MHLFEGHKGPKNDVMRLGLAFVLSAMMLGRRVGAVAGAKVKLMVTTALAPFRLGISRKTLAKSSIVVDT